MDDSHILGTMYNHSSVSSNKLATHVLYDEHVPPLLFYSHVPHQGAKVGEDPEGCPRANVVLHYQQNPMFPGISFVSNPQFTLDTLGYAGTFPFSN